MNITIRCLKCKETFLVDQTMKGQELNCPHCNQKLVIPTQTNIKKQGIHKKYDIATWSLILGLASFMCSLFTAIPAIICGHMSLSQIKKSNEKLSKNKALTGLICGYIGIGMFFVIMLVSDGNLDSSNQNINSPKKNLSVAEKSKKLIEKYNNAKHIKNRKDIKTLISALRLINDPKAREWEVGGPYSCWKYFTNDIILTKYTKTYNEIKKIENQFDKRKKTKDAEGILNNIARNYKETIPNIKEYINNIFYIDFTTSDFDFKYDFNSKKLFLEMDDKTPYLSPLYSDTSYDFDIEWPAPSKKYLLLFDSCLNEYTIRTHLGNFKYTKEYVGFVTKISETQAEKISRIYDNNKLKLRLYFSVTPKIVEETHYNSNPVNIKKIQQKKVKHFCGKIEFEELIDDSNNVLLKFE